MILDDLANVEPLLRAGCTHELDASRPLDEVVADLLAIAARPMRRPETGMRRTSSEWIDGPVRSASPSGWWW